MIMHDMVKQLVPWTTLGNSVSKGDESRIHGVV